MNVWNKLEKPIMCLAPMEGVTDTVFRQVVDGCGKPDVSFTEFTSVDGMYSRGYDFVARRLKYVESEKPLVAQIWGLDPANFEKAGNLLVKKGFDGVDLNMGCPVKDVTKKGAGGAMVDNRKLAKELILATQRGVGGRIPVSVKVRTGNEVVVTEEWVKYLLELNIDALIVHGRTVKQKSKVAADWNEISKAVKIRDEMGVETVIIGNGDVKSLTEANEKVKTYGVDGVMIGRGIFENPWVFNVNENFEDKAIQEKLNLLLKHVDLYEKTWGENKHFDVLKKFFKIYVNDFTGAKKLRVELMDCENVDELRKVVVRFGKMQS